MIIKRDSFEFDRVSKISPASEFPAGPLIPPTDELHELILEIVKSWTIKRNIKRWLIRKFLVEKRKYLLDIAAYGPGDMRQSCGTENILYVKEAKGFEGWEFTIRIHTEDHEWVNGFILKIKNKGIEYCTIEL